MPVLFIAVALVSDGRLSSDPGVLLLRGVERKLGLAGRLASFLAHAHRAQCGRKAFAARVRVWLATGHTDMRKGFASLSPQMQEALRRDPLSGHLFCFRGRRGKLYRAPLPVRLCEREHAPNDKSIIASAPLCRS